MPNTPSLSKYRFRMKTPIKRYIGYQKDVTFKHYRQELKEDFSGRCGYCDSLFSIVKKDYHIDHFIPQRLLKKFPTHANLIDDYSNLIYSCPSCNKSKSGKWPSENPDISIADGIGFVDPCQESYGDMFFRDREGNILANNEQYPVSLYIHRELKLYLDTHKIVWKIEQLMKMIKNFSPEESEATKIELFEQLQLYLIKHFEMDINENYE